MSVRDYTHRPHCRLWIFHLQGWDVFIQRIKKLYKEYSSLDSLKRFTDQIIWNQISVKQTSSRKWRSEVKLRDSSKEAVCIRTSLSSVLSPPLFSTASTSSVFSIRSSCGIPRASNSRCSSFILQLRFCCSMCFSNFERQIFFSHQNLWKFVVNKKMTTGFNNQLPSNHCYDTKLSYLSAKGSTSCKGSRSDSSHVNHSQNRMHKTSKKTQRTKRATRSSIVYLEPSLRVFLCLPRQLSTPTYTTS